MKRIIYLLTAFLSLSSCIYDSPEGADLAIGDTIPDFTVIMNDGTEVSAQMLRNTPSCIMFFHTSCPDCQKALPVMQRIYDEYSSKGVQFALISREEEESSIEAFWQEKGLTMRYSPQPTREVYNLFAQTRVPRIYVCEKGGVIRNIYTDDPVPEYEELAARLNYVCGTDKE